MRILHYFLGFPPYRSGGLTKFAYDLMVSQAKNNDDVFALWPGKIKFFYDKVSIKKRKSINGVESFELINPLPVPLDEGILYVEKYTKKCDEMVYRKFLESIEPDVIHIHTLMGLHQEFVAIAKKLNIKTVFTTHDYFGICPKVTLFKNGNVCDCDNNCIDCVNCNKTALSINKIKLMQAPIYRKFKNNFFVAKLRKKHRQKFLETNSNISLRDPSYVEESEKYIRLRNYYLEIFNSIDLFHFNSTQTKEIYNRYFRPNKSKVISITHQNIEDNRNLNTWKYTGKLRISYLSPPNTFKGYNLLCEVLDYLWKKGKRDFELNLYSSVYNKKDYMKIHEEGYTYDQLPEIFNNTDILVAPSIGYETYGFTVLEALSFGVPVLISNRVGAKDIVKNSGIIIDFENISNFRQILETLDSSKLSHLRDNIVNLELPLWQDFLKEIYSLYKEEFN